MEITFVTTGDIEKIATSKRAFGLAEPMTTLGYQVSIILENTPNNRSRLRQEAPSAEGLWFEPSTPLAEAKWKRKAIQSKAPDYVYVCSLGARNLAWSPALGERANFVVEHSELSSAIKNQPLRRRLTALGFEKASLGLFDGHIVASRYLERYVTKDLRHYGLKRSIHYSPYAFSQNMMMPRPEFSEPLRNAVGSKKVLLYMGTLSKNYGILDIIEAVDAIRRDVPDLLLIVLGQGRDAESAKAIVESRGLQDHIRLEGYVSDEALPSYLDLADAFIAPLFDTVQDIARCPSKLFLYLPFKRPIVTSRIGEAEELFGDYEYYFRPGDVGDMTRALREALSVAPDWDPPWAVDAHSWKQRAKFLDSWLRALPRKGVK